MLRWKWGQPLNCVSFVSYVFGVECGTSSSPLAMEIMDDCSRRYSLGVVRYRKLVWKEGRVDVQEAVGEC